MAYALTRRSFWRSFKRNAEGCRPKFSLSLCLFEEGFSLDLFGLFIPLLFLDRWRYEPHEIMERWGFYWMERSAWFCWGDRVKSVDMPWDLKHLKCEVMRPDGTWTKYVASYDKGDPDGRWTATYPYSYTLRSGEVQERTATVYVERREWRWRSMMWNPLIAKRRQSISVEFNDEVGERTGSWKGGCVGCGYTMKPGETPLDTLRRMEKERDF